MRRTEEREEAQVKGTINSFNKIIDKSLPSLKKEQSVKVQEEHKIDSNRKQSPLST